MTDFLQLIHGTIRNLIPVESGGAESDDENERNVQNTVRYELTTSFVLGLPRLHNLSFEYLRKPR